MYLFIGGKMDLKQNNIAVTLHYGYYKYQFWQNLGCNIIDLFYIDSSLVVHIGSILSTLSKYLEVKSHIIFEATKKMCAKNLSQTLSRRRQIILMFIGINFPLRTWKKLEACLIHRKLMFSPPQTPPSQAGRQCWTWILGHHQTWHPHSTVK